VAEPFTGPIWSKSAWSGKRKSAPGGGPIRGHGQCPDASGERSFVSGKSLPDSLPAATAFLEAACVPRHGHSSGTLEEAEMILARHPQVTASNIYTAAVVADEATVRAFLARDPDTATSKGGPRGWDALSHLCFSRYLRLDRARSDAFVRTGRALLDAGASVNTGWIEMTAPPIHGPSSKPRSTARPGSPSTRN
jgi:hypothetical protein